jgi:hypothetical protein
MPDQAGSCSDGSHPLTANGIAWLENIINDTALNDTTAAIAFERLLAIDTTAA